jgi:hypothetical protein
MDKHEQSEVLKMLTVMAENFNAEASPAMLKMVLSALGAADFNQVRFGLNRIMRVRKFTGFPPLAEILEACGLAEEKDPVEIEAEQQWLKALDAPGPSAPYHRVIKSYDPATGTTEYEDPEPDGLTSEGKAALRAIGGVPARGQIFARRDFLEAYKRFKKSRVEQLPVKNLRLSTMAKKIKGVDHG